MTPCACLPRKKGKRRNEASPRIKPSAASASAVHHCEDKRRTLSKGRSCREQMATHPHTTPDSVQQQKASEGVAELRKMKCSYTKSSCLLAARLLGQKNVTPLVSILRRRDWSVSWCEVDYKRHCVHVNEMERRSLTPSFYLRLGLRPYL